MVSLHSLARTSIVFGLIALMALALSHLALVDISQGEADLRAEWLALQICAVILVASIVTSIVTATKVLRRV